MYVRKEAVLSSQIEGTQATLEDVLSYEIQRDTSGPAGDAAEVTNYVRAMNYGLERCKTLPLSLRLIREIHGELMRDVRGGELARTPGEFRTSQNWIGPLGSTLNEASFVPPPVNEMKQSLYDWENFQHSEEPISVLVKSAIMHAQFETIHPFVDGNGRIGRLLITFQLCQAGLLHSPLLYLSYYFKTYREEYYHRLDQVRRQGDWEGWLLFFLRGVATVAKQATETAEAILDLHSVMAEAVQAARPRGARNALRALDYLFDRPFITSSSLQSALSITAPTANALIEAFVEIDALTEITQQSYGRTYRFAPYIDLLRDATSEPPGV